MRSPGFQFPGLIELVLTVLAFWFQVRLVPRLPTSCRIPRLCPPTSISLMALSSKVPCIRCPRPRSHLPPVQKRDAQHIFGNPVDQVVADPMAQDNDKRCNIQIHTEIPYQSTQRKIFTSCRYLVELGPRQLGLPTYAFATLDLPGKLAILTAIYRSAQGPGQKVPRGVLVECFWAPGSECPKECFWSAAWRLWSPKSSQTTLEKALRGALCGPGPWALL